MKKLLFIIIAVFFSVGLYAQINLSTTDNKVFGLTNPQNVSTANWVIDADATVYPAGLTFTHTFGTIGDYVVRATPVSALTCTGTQQSVNVHVVADITTLDIQVSWVALADACSGIASSGSVTIQNINNAAHPFVAGDALRIYYTIDGGTEAYVDATVAANTGTSTATVSIPTTSLAAGARSVVMTRFRYNGEQTSYASVSASKTTSLDINPIPTIDGIE